MAFTVYIHPERKYQTIKGFGQSGCWWATDWDRYYTEADFDRALAYMYSATDGIGLTHYRYNIGGGTQAEHLPHSRHTQCIEVAPGEYDLSVDATNIGVMEKVLALGAKHVTLFMNSPPARMTVSGDTNGNPTGETNHREDCYEAYAKYVADITKLFVDAGYPILYVSPINEPQWDWSKGWQEGCHYSVDQTMAIDKLVIEELERTCPSVRISMPETAAWYQEEYTLEFIRRMAADPVIRNHVDHFGGHSYCSESFHRKKVFDVMKETGLNLPIHQTEWAEMSAGTELDMDGGIVMSEIIHQDLTLMNCPLWEYWVGVDGKGNWRGALVYIRDKGVIETPKRLWAMGNYSKFLPGATRIGMEVNCAERTIVFGSAYEREDGSQVVVLTNTTAAPKTVTFSGACSQQAQVFLTDETHDLEDMGVQDMSGEYAVPARAVVTLIFS